MKEGLQDTLGSVDWKLPTAERKAEEQENLRKEKKRQGCEVRTETVYEYLKFWILILVQMSRR